MHGNVDITLQPFDQLEKRDLYDIMVLRNMVFVVEQQITEEPEIDGLDPVCHHTVARVGGEGIVGTARVFFNKSPVKVGRVAVDRDYRNRGIGTAVMKHIQQQLGGERAFLHAQIQTRDWYERLGWRPVGDVFDEAGIEHIEMRWPPS